MISFDVFYREEEGGDTCFMKVFTDEGATFLEVLDKVIEALREEGVERIQGLKIYNKDGVRFEG